MKAEGEISPSTLYYRARTIEKKINPNNRYACSVTLWEWAEREKERLRELARYRIKRRKVGEY
jgi:hypothetical protein